MPYNNTPITPSKEVTGHVSLPLARVQKIIQADPERLATSKNASFAIALATEMFIQHLATTTHNVVKAERKPRRNIQYRDVSAAVAKTDNLEFLVDVVPKTVTYREFKKKQEKMAKERESEKERNGNMAPKDGGEKAKDGGVERKEDGENEDEADESRTFPVAEEREREKAPEAMDIEDDMERVEDSEPEQDEAAMQIEMEMEMRGPPRPSGSPRTRRSGGFTAINGK